jgi:hypothetical protein
MVKKKVVVKKWSKAKDTKFDKKKGWKEGSKGDMKQDKAHGIKENLKKKKK